MAVSSLPCRLLVRDHDSTDGTLRRETHGGIDGSVMFDHPAHVSSSRKLISMARAECVIAPDDTKSAPVSA